MSTKFCDTCEKIMKSSLELVTGEGTSYGIVYKCPICNTSKIGGDDDVCIYTGETEVSGGSGTRAIMLNKNIQLVANDPVYCKVKQECSNCGLPYMTLVRSGQEEHVMMVCKCGNTAAYNPSE